MNCDLCGLDLATENYSVVRSAAGVSAIHVRCGEAWASFRQFSSMHSALCHLPDCDRGPVSPFPRVPS